MKKEAFLINTARGKHVDEQALFDLLRSGHIGGAGLDSLVDWSLKNKLFELENVVLSPHSAWFTKESLENAADMILANVEAHISGKPINVVNS